MTCPFVYNTSLVRCAQLKSPIVSIVIFWIITCTMRKMFCIGEIGRALRTEWSFARTSKWRKVKKKTTKIASNFYCGCVEISSFKRPADEMQWSDCIYSGLYQNILKCFRKSLLSRCNSPTSAVLVGIVNKIIRSSNRMNWLPLSTESSRQYFNGPPSGFQKTAQLIFKSISSIFSRVSTFSDTNCVYPFKEIEYSG